MRVVVATDAVGPLRSAEAGTVIGSAFADGPAAAEVAVVPVGESGSGFLQALADQVGAELGIAAVGDALTVSLVPASSQADAVVAVGLDEAAAPPPAGPSEHPPGIDYAASSFPLGEALRTALADAPSPPEVVVIDLGGLTSHDGGAGLLAGLGATSDVPLTEGVAGLAGLERLDLDPVRALLGGARLVGVVPSDQVTRPLLGLRGVTSLLGRDLHGSSGWSEDPARLLATDATLEQLARCAGPEAAAVPGAGAAGGAGYAVLALGGELVTGTRWLAERLGLAATARRADLVVTGCTRVDFGTKGGGVVAAMASMAEDAMRPCIVLAQEVQISTRELRAMGVESAYGVREATAGSVPPDLTADELRATAERIARSWSW